MPITPGVASTVCLALGCAVYAVSFFLLAVRVSNQDVPGWMCALLSITSSGEPSKFNLWLFGSGLLNVAVLFYLGARLNGSAITARRFVVAGVVLCLLFTWGLFAHQGMKPLCGHYLWAAGAILITFWDALPARH